MKAVWISSFGGPENLEIREVGKPRTLTGSELLVRVRAAGLNRADLLQRRGLYPPPSGISPNIPGLEFAGDIVGTGEKVTKFAVSDRVFGIVAGEAQAEFLITSESLVSKIPAKMDHIEAAAVPEAFITAHDAVFAQAGLRDGETLLIHAVGSGVGLAALAMAKARGHHVLGTSRTEDKLAECRKLGLDEAISTAAGADFAAAVIERTAGLGVDVILDLVGAAYFPQNIECLGAKGRLMLVGLTSGAKADFNLAAALAKRLTVKGTVLRSRPDEEKAEAIRSFENEVLPLLAEGRIRPEVDKVFSFTEVESAHRYLESNESFGKVILEF